MMSNAPTPGHGATCKAQTMSDSVMLMHTLRSCAFRYRYMTWRGGHSLRCPGVAVFAQAHSQSHPQPHPLTAPSADPSPKPPGSPPP
jgi:hypothetical protein